MLRVYSAVCYFFLSEEIGLHIERRWEGSSAPYVPTRLILNHILKSIKTGNVSFFCCSCLVSSLYTPTSSSFLEHCHHRVQLKELWNFQIFTAQRLWHATLSYENWQWIFYIFFSYSWQANLVAHEFLHDKLYRRSAATAASDSVKCERTYKIAGAYLTQTTMI